MVLFIIVICSLLVGMLLSMLFDFYKLLILHIIAILIMVGISIVIHFEFEPSYWGGISYYLAYFFAPILISLIGTRIPKNRVME